MKSALYFRWNTSRKQTVWKTHQISVTMAGSRNILRRTSVTDRGNIDLPYFEEYCPAIETYTNKSQRTDRVHRKSIELEYQRGPTIRQNLEKQCD